MTEKGSTIDPEGSNTEFKLLHRSFTKNKLMDKLPYNKYRLFALFFFFLFICRMVFGMRVILIIWGERREKTFSRLRGFQTHKVQLRETQDWHFTWVKGISSLYEQCGRKNRPRKNLRSTLVFVSDLGSFFWKSIPTQFSKQALLKPLIFLKSISDMYCILAQAKPLRFKPVCLFLYVYNKNLWDRSTNEVEEESGLSVWSKITKWEGWGKKGRGHKKTPRVRKHPQERAGNSPQIVDRTVSTSPSKKRQTHLRPGGHQCLSLVGYGENLCLQGCCE